MESRKLQRSLAESTRAQQRHFIAAAPSSAALAHFEQLFRYET